MKTRSTIREAISVLSTLLGCVSLPSLVVAYWVNGDIFSLLKEKATIPVWYLLFLMLLLLAVFAIAVGQWLTQRTPKKERFNSTPDISVTQQDEQLIKDYMLRIKGVLGNKSSYSMSQISHKLKLPEFNEQCHKNLQRAIGRLVEEGVISAGKSGGTYQLIE